MESQETTKDDGESHPTTEPTAAKKSKSDITDSELSETFCPICGGKRRKFIRKESGYLFWRCRQCGHIYISPRPSEAVLADYYATGYMPQTEDENVWEKTRYRVYDAAARAIAKAMPQRGDLLDVGAGFGGFLDRAAKDGWRLSGIERNESAFAVCKRRFGPKANLQQASFEKAQFAASSFDCIMMLNVIEHVHDPLKICERVFQLLRPGGCLALRWPQYIFTENLWPPAHLHYFTRRSIEILFHSTGFTDVQEHWASTQDYRSHRLDKYIQATILRTAARIFFTCTFGKRQIPFVSRLMLARKPK